MSSTTEVHASQIIANIEGGVYPREAVLTIARGFLPALTRSRHWLADPRFAAAIAEWCAREREATTSYRDAVLVHSPYLDADPPAAASR